jgi:HEAT repeat protein
MQLITDPDSLVRSRATGLLAGFNEPTVIEALIPLLQDKDMFVRSAAAGSLNHMFLRINHIQKNQTDQFLWPDPNFCLAHQELSNRQ